MKKILSFLVVAAIICFAVVMQLSNMGIIKLGGAGGGIPGGDSGGGAIEGMWFGNANGVAIGWIFQGNMYQMWENTAMKQSGAFTLAGNTLALSINETGGSEKLTVQFGADGATLNMTDQNGVTVNFQRQQPGGTQMPNPAPPQPVPQPAPVPPAPAPQPDASIEGRWTYRDNNETLTFVFFGGQYQYILNGSVQGRGPYTIQGDTLYITPEGKGPQTMKYKLSSDGKTLSLDAGDGNVVLFQREG